MKKIILGILTVIAILGLSGRAVASIMIPAADQAKGKAGVAVEKSPAIEGDWALTPPGLEKIEFIHYKKDFARPEGPKAPKPPACYKFLTPGKNPIRWRELPVNYVINPTNPVQTLEQGFVCSAVSTSAKAWDASTGSELFENYVACPIDDGVAYGVQDYKNALLFGDYPTTGVIAVTTVWYNPVTKAIVEFDVMFDTDWIWGNLGDTESPPVEGATVMDLQNIATHELGHAVGLGDVYDSVCSVVTMYGYSDYGETQKRTLETPDITGLQKLYGL